MSKRLHDLGDGPECPDNAQHGRLYKLASDRLWCPVDEAVYGPSVYDEATRTFIAGPVIRAAQARAGQVVAL